jgi:hypothetical protein
MARQSKPKSSLASGKKRKKQDDFFQNDEVDDEFLHNEESDQEDEETDEDEQEKIETAEGKRFRLGEFTCFITSACL